MNFVNVSGEAGKLGDLVPTGYGETYSEGEIMVSQVNENGGELDGVVYTWFDFMNEDVGAYWYGWYNEDGDCCNNLPISLGEGVMFQAPSSDIKIQVAGQVYGSALPIQLRLGFMMVANPVPSAIKMATMTIDGYGETYSEGEIMLSQINENGGELDGVVYTWFDFMNEDVGEYWYGWYNEDGENCGTIDIECGEAVMLQAPSDEIYIHFPTAL